jgi:hypothetical protein
MLERFKYHRVGAAKNGYKNITMVAALKMNREKSRAPLGSMIFSKVIIFVLT